MQFVKINVHTWKTFKPIEHHICRRSFVIRNCYSLSLHRQNNLFAKKYFFDHSYHFIKLSLWSIKLSALSNKQFSYINHELKTVKMTVKNAVVEHQDKLVVLTLSNGNEYKFPWLWMRDNCQCESCFNLSSHSRTIDWKTFDTKVFPEKVSISEDTVHVRWSDSHESKFSLSWLLDRSFTTAVQEAWLTGTYQLPKVSWDSQEFPRILRRFSFTDTMNSDDCLLEWLESLAVHGVALLENTPCRPDQVRQLSNRVAFIRKTFYGEEFQVTVQPDATNFAYLSAPLQMHTDLPYYRHKPGVNILHCLVQAVGRGGENQLTDGLRVVERLKTTHPDVYRILADTLVEWSDIARDKTNNWFIIHRAPVICEDSRGNFASINYSQQQRDSHLSVPLELVNQWYEAHAVFTQTIHHPDYTVFLKTKPGEILTFDNLRILHGRTGYDSMPGHERHLVGAYLDWDEIYSRIRVLRKTFGHGSGNV